MILSAACSGVISLANLFLLKSCALISFKTNIVYHLNVHLFLIYRNPDFTIIFFVLCSLWIFRSIIIIFYAIPSSKFIFFKRWKPFCKNLCVHILQCIWHSTFARKYRPCKFRNRLTPSRLPARSVRTMASTGCRSPCHQNPSNGGTTYSKYPSIL